MFFTIGLPIFLLAIAALLILFIRGYEIRHRRDVKLIADSERAKAWLRFPWSIQYDELYCEE